MPTRLASSTLVIRPSAWISLRILRSIASIFFDTRVPVLKARKRLAGCSRNTLNPARLGCAILLRVRCAISPCSREILLIWIAILAWLARCLRVGFDAFGAVAVPSWANSARAPAKFPLSETLSMSAPIHAKVVIIGSGPAGYTAAIYAARAMLEPVLIQGIQPGGQLTITTDVENYPGFADVIQGPWLMEQMEKQAAHVGTKIVTDLVNKLELGQRPFRLTCDSGEVYLAETVILATGAQARWLGLPSEEKFKGFGVSACATCDGFFYRGKQVIVVGGGNTAVEEALFLTNFASRVTVVHRRDSFRAEKILQERLYKNPKISVLWHTVLDDVIGDENPLKVNRVRLKNLKTGAVTE